MRPTTDLQRTVAPFEVISEYTPSGDQPTAIAELARRVKAGDTDTAVSYTHLTLTTIHLV